ncbi:MAG: hypothetical protein IPI24_04675 [Ignavibacteria bacterium]|nr:hypothetical protein [Ignavibacteria bacterium]
MKILRFITFSLCFWVLAHISVTTLSAGVLLQPDEPYAFTRVGVNTFIGVNVIYAQEKTLLLATFEDLFRSTDKGATWNTVAEPLSYRHVTSIDPRGDTVFAGMANGSTFRTTNHGLDWKSYSRVARDSASEPTSLPGIHAKGNTHVWVGIKDSIMTIEYWYGVSRSISRPEFSLASACATVDSLVFIALKRYGILRLNTNNDVVDTLPLGHLNGAFFSALAVQDGFLYAGVKLGRGGLHRRPLSGTLFESVINDRESGIIEITCLQPSARGMYIGTKENGVLFAGRSSRIMRSISDGLYRGMAQNIVVIDSTVFVACRLRGVYVMHGVSDEIRPLPTPIPQSPEYILGSLGTSVVVGFADGRLLRSPDKGRTWDSIPSPFKQAHLNALTSRGNTLYAATLNGVWCTSDTGRTWRPLDPSLNKENVQKVVFHDSVIVVIASSNAFFHYPSGTTIAFDPKLTLDHLPRLVDVLFYNNKLYGVGYPGLYASDDNGRTWTVFKMPPKVMVVRTLAITNNTMYIATDMGQLMSCPLP